MIRRACGFLTTILSAAPVFAASYYTVRLDDPKAVYLPVRNSTADSAADDSDAIQAAIDKAQENGGEGIVFVPSGRYRLTKTINVWPAVRVIGYGATRPVFFLAPNTPGYQDPANERYMVFFAGGRPGGGRGGAGRGGANAPSPDAAAGRGGANQQTQAAGAGRGAGGGGGRGGNGQPSDAGAGTFYSAISNIDIEIGDGNPGAVGIRGRYAQHCYMAHMDFHIGSGLAGVHETGNVAEDVHFFGGQYGVWTQTPSPGWQFTMVDATFEGQREAAIRERQAGLTLIRPHFHNVPTAIETEPNFGDNLWIKDGRMEDISGPALLIGDENGPRTEINLENVVCRRVPLFAQFRESGKKTAGPADIYEARTFSHGIAFADAAALPEPKDVFDAVNLTALPPERKSDLPSLPPAETWVNIRTLGAKGDASTDDTDAFRKAIAEHRAIYLPSGKYVVSDTLTLRPDTVLIGLHPSATEIVLLDRTPAFQGVGGPKPMIEAPKGGTNIMIGIGLYTNGMNPRAVAAKWMAGADSLMNDVRFLGGHGTNSIAGGRENPYNNAHTADPDMNRRWDGQYPSLWVTDGGGGTFFDIWTPSTFAQAGMLVSDTTTEGRVYQMSSEHHVRNEIQIRNAANWRIYALQTEEERGEGPFALPLEISGSHDITVANYHIYRVISSYQPFPDAIRVTDSKNIRFRNIHCYSNSKVSFDAAVHDVTHDAEARQREFAWLTLTGAAPAVRPKTPSPVLAAGARVEKLAGGFYNISGGAADPTGDFYFVDAHWQTIYRWSAASREVTVVRDNALDPINLAIDKAGNLMVVSYAGNGIVYAFKPGAPGDDVTILQAQPAAARPNMTPVLATSDWRVRGNPQTGEVPARAFQFLSPDGTTYISAGQDFASGAVSWGIKSADVLRSFGLAPAIVGKPFYMTDEAEAKTLVANVGPDGNLSGLKVFAYQGGESVAVDAEGNVYIAAGRIYVYSPAGKLIDSIDVPERPVQLVFGGKDGQTLFIAARASLYSVRTRVKGR